MKRIIFYAILTAAFIWSNAFSQVKFESGSLRDVLDKAKSEKKVLMVDVLTEWCKWCVELDNKVYAKKDVYEFANKYQVNYKIDAEKGEGIDFAKKYNVQGYPTVLFLDGDGNEIDRVYGYLPAKQFLEIMMDYNKGMNTFGALKNALEKDPNDILANIKMADKLIALGELDKARKNLRAVIDIDPQNLSGKADDAKYKLASIADKESIINDLESFIKDNPDSDVLKDAYISLSESYYFVKEDAENSDKYYKKTLELYPDDEYVNSSYGQYLNARAVTLADKGAGEDDYRKGLSLVQAALPFVSGSVNEASSYFIQSKLYFNLKEYNSALESVNKALKIFNRKLYRDMKEKIEKQLSSKQ